MDVFVARALVDTVAVIPGLRDVSGEADVVVECVDVLLSRGENDCVTEPVDVFDVDEEAVIVFVRTDVVEGISVIDTHEDNDGVDVSVINGVVVIVELQHATRVGEPEVAEDMVGDIDSEEETEALLDMSVLPERVFGLVDVFVAGILREPVDDTVDVRETVTERVAFADPVDVRETVLLALIVFDIISVFEIKAERVPVLDGSCVLLRTGVDVNVLDLFDEALNDDEPVDVFVIVIDDVVVRLTICEAVCLIDTETEGDDVDVFDGRILNELVDEPVIVLEPRGVLDSVGLALGDLDRPADTVFVLDALIVRVDVLDDVTVVVPLPVIEIIALNVLVLEGTVERVAVLVDVAVFVEKLLTVCL